MRSLAPRPEARRRSWSDPMATKKTTKSDEKAPKATKAKGDKAPKAAKAAGDKKTNGKSASKAGAARVAKAAKEAAVKVAGGPLAKLKAIYGSKESLVGKIVEPLAAKDEDTDALKQRIATASNKQLLRLAKVVETVTKKYGSREKLVESLGKTLGKAKDSDFLAKLESFSLPK